MSVGDPADGYDAVLIRHGVGNAECPITYDLVTVGVDKSFAVIPDVNKCSRILNINVEGDKLMLVTEKQNGRTEVIEYNDKQRRHDFFPKPFRIKDLLESVERALGRGCLDRKPV